MALTNWDLITLVNLVRNKDLEGEDITADEFQTLINSQSQLLFAEKLGVPNTYQVGAPITKTGAEVSRKISQELRPFYVREVVTIIGSVGDFSGKEIGYLDAIDPANLSGRGLDELEGSEVADRLGSAVVAPTEDDPCFEWRDGTSILVYPSTVSSIVLKYYKYPANAVIATTTNSTTLLEEYDSGNSTELLWEDEQKIEIAYRILRDIGINMERQDVTAYAQNIVSNE
jgi:hypothetical protein